MRGLFALIQKELGAHRAYVGLLVFLAGLDLFSRTFTSLARAQLLDTWVLLDGDGSEIMTLFQLALAIALGQSMLGAELDQRTVRLIDALPTTRLHAFAAKAIVLFGLLLLNPLLGAATTLLLHGWARTSLEHGFRLPLVATVLFLWTVQAVAFCGLGLLLAYLRQAAWLVAVLLILFLVSAVQRSPAFEVLNTWALVAPELRGGQLDVHGAAVNAHVSLGVLFLVVAALLFTGPGERLFAWLTLGGRVQKVLSWTFAIGGIALLWGLSTLAVVAPFHGGADDDTDGQEPDATFSTRSAEVAVTTRYRVTYPGALRARARTIIDEGDAVHDRVIALLGAEPLASIDVDATADLSSAMLHGLATWRSARISLAHIEEPARLLEVLAHETVHVYVAELSDRRASERSRATRLFNEGLATWVEHQLHEGDGDGDDASSAAGRALFHAALLRDREDLRLEDLLADDDFRRKLHSDAVYPLGASAVHAAARACGDDAVPRAFGAMREEALAEIGDPEALWRAAFARAGCRFDDVINTWSALLEERWARQGAIASAIPRPHAKVQLERGSVVVEVGPEALHGAASCRLRPHAAAHERHTVLVRVDEDGRCEAPASRFPRGELEVQVGVYVPATARWLWNGWRRFTLADLPR